MNTEELGEQTARAEPLHFDAHEFDGLREELDRHAATLLKRADEFVRTNPWMCIALAVGIGCALGAAATCSARQNRDLEEDTVA